MDDMTRELKRMADSLKSIAESQRAMVAELRAEIPSTSQAERWPVKAQDITIRGTRELSQSDAPMQGGGRAEQNSQCAHEPAPLTIANHGLDKRTAICKKCGASLVSVWIAAGDAPQDTLTLATPDSGISADSDATVPKSSLCQHVNMEDDKWYCLDCHTWLTLDDRRARLQRT